MNSAPMIHPHADEQRSGLLYLRDRVYDYFRDYGVPASVAPVGLKYRYFQLNQGPGGGNRVVFIPGEFDGDTKVKPRKYGTVNRETRNSASVVNPRELASWERHITISIWAAPVPGKSEQEDLSVGIVDDLYEQVVRASVNAVRGAIHWGDVMINAPPDETGFGVELLARATLIGPFFDASRDVAVAVPVVPSRKFT